MELLKNDFNTYIGTERARLSRDFVQKHGMNCLNITPTAFNLMLAIGPYVDYEGYIQLSKSQMRRLIDVNPRFFVRTFESAINANVLEEREDGIYSKVHTFKAMSEVTFIPNFSRLTEGRFPSVGLRPSRLFAYIMASRPTGLYHVVNIENLYRNNLHTADNGINYFHDAKQVVDALIALLRNDLIEMKLPLGNGNEIILDKQNMKDHRTLLESHVEIETVEDLETKELKKKKTRTSEAKVSKETHVLYIKLSSSLLNSKQKVKASETELEAMFLKHDYRLDLLRKESITSIIGIKNALYKAAGKVGLSLYRNAVNNYLKEKLPIIDFHDNKDFGLHDHIMNYYLLVDIKKVLLKAASVLKGMTDPQQFKISTSFGELTEKELRDLLSFYTAKASINHLIIMEKELHDLNIALVDINKTNAPWNKIYNSLPEKFVEFVETEGPILNLSQFRKIAFSAAQEHLFTQKEKYEKFLKEYKALHMDFSDLLMASGDNTNSNYLPPGKLKTVRFYNWLEERD